MGDLSEEGKDGVAKFGHAISVSPFLTFSESGRGDGERRWREEVGESREEMKREDMEKEMKRGDEERG